MVRRLALFVSLAHTYVTKLTNFDEIAKYNVRKKAQFTKGHTDNTDNTDILCASLITSFTVMFAPATQTANAQSVTVG